MRKYVHNAPWAMTMVLAMAGLAGQAMFAPDLLAPNLLAPNLLAQGEERGEPKSVPIVIRYDAEAIYLSNGLVDALFTPKFCRRVCDRVFAEESGRGTVRLRMLPIDGQDRQPDGVFVGRLAILKSPDLERHESLFKAAIRELEQALSERLSGPRQQSSERECRQLEAELQEAEARLAALADRHAQVRDRTRALEKAERAHVERQRLEVEMAASDAEQSALTERLMQAERERARFESQRQKLAEKLDQRTAQLRELEAALNRNLQPKERSKLELVHASAVRAMDQAQAVLEQQQQRAQATEDRLAAASDAMLALATRIDSLRARAKALESTAKARDSMADAVAQAERLEQDVRLLEERRGRLTVELDEVRSTRRSGVRVRVQRW